MDYVLATGILVVFEAVVVGLTAAAMKLTKETDAKIDWGF